MIEAIVMVVVQILFNFVRVASHRHTTRDNVWQTVGYGMLVQVLWLTTNFLGIRAMFEQNYVVVIFYVIGGAIGTYLAFKLNIDKEVCNGK